MGPDQEVNTVVVDVDRKKYADMTKRFGGKGGNGSGNAGSGGDRGGSGRGR